MNLAFVEQSILVPDEFKAAVTRAAHDYFPKKRELGAVEKYVDNHVECLQAAISEDFPECQVKAKPTPNEIRFTIDLSTRDTGFAYITLPITCENGAVYVGGVE